MKCILIDDEKTALTILEKWCSKVAWLEVEACFSNAIDAIKYINQNEVDLVFLDLHMPDFSGFDVLQTLTNPPKIIVTTSDREFAIEAFEHSQIVGYLVKPIAFSSFEKAIEKIERVQQPSVSDSLSKTEVTENLFVTVNKKLIKVHIPKILLIEAKGDYIHLKTKEKNYLVHATLKKIEKKLPQHLFFRVHRSFIINLSSIVDIQDNSVLIEKQIIPVSRKNRTLLLKSLNKL